MGFFGHNSYFGLYKAIEQTPMLFFDFLFFFFGSRSHLLGKKKVNEVNVKKVNVLLYFYLLIIFCLLSTANIC